MRCHAIQRKAATGSFPFLVIVAMSSRLSLLLLLGALVLGVTSAFPAAEESQEGGGGGAGKLGARIA